MGWLTWQVRNRSVSLPKFVIRANLVWYVIVTYVNGRGGRTRTGDHMTPSHVRYQLRHTPLGEIQYNLVISGMSARRQVGRK